MSPSLRSRFWQMLLRRIFKGQHITITQYCAREAQGAGFTSVPKNVKVDKFDIDGIHAEWISLSSADSDKVVLHLHGGGYVTGGMNSYQMMCVSKAQTLMASSLRIFIYR